MAVTTNDLLRERLEPYFGEDTFAMKQFLYWLDWADEYTDQVSKDLKESSLESLADSVLIEKSFLEDVIWLLREKGQVIFYGPPGTGKTFVARALAKYLAAELSRREIVQFHPSYSYEDFVQGYRPVRREDGSLAYDLKHGPLMRLAHAAMDTPGRDHVLLIDEINRGNLPKILGELLYLLEYRGDDVALMYGEDGERFSLPENLYIIGTMNTADRSIALVDAALRRRFHFVRFFPEEYPLETLLSRWLERNRPEMIEVARIVDRLNSRLRDRIGPHLQVGPSYFMREDLSELVLENVWAHDIMPFLEDQLFGHEEELANYTLENLWEEGSADD
jgi:5-methylcytosine-specific restriction enzyme B